MVEFAVNGTKTPGYLAKPASGSGPGVIVIQEWWGLVPHIKDIADRFAQAGYVALAPDLYHGKATTSPDEAGKMMMALQIGPAEKDLAGAVRYLQTVSKGTKVGVVGFCMGGALSLYAASKNADIGACVVYYGVHPNVKPDLAALHGPVLGFYAEKDGFTTPAVVKELDGELTRLGKSHEFHTYPDTDHAFFNDTRPVYDEHAAKDSWQRMLGFFHDKL
ncbi:MAG TPA: dienelactone hydrolase family protein [Candidatus Xenobia bacterium]|jgi:carboxymethylenebutenolidase